MNEKIVAVLLAGGLSRRMGGRDKMLRELGGESILARVITRVEPQVDKLLLNANGDPARFAEFGLPVAADVLGDHAGLCTPEPLGAGSRAGCFEIETGAETSSFTGQDHDAAGPVGPDCLEGRMQLVDPIALAKVAMSPTPHSLNINPLQRCKGFIAITRI